MTATRNPRGTEMRLGLFLGRSDGFCEWLGPRSQAEEYHRLSYSRDLAALAERGRFDLVFRADGLEISPSKLGRKAMFGLEPLVHLAALAGVTEHVGLVGTLNTTFSDPYVSARQFATLDHLSDGRAGWNMVTTPGSVKNFTNKEVLAHNAAYDRAEEFVRLAEALWTSWEPDALVVDRAAQVFADGSKVHPVHHRGTYFDVEGPLNIPRSPQGRPLLAQAGISPVGKDFGARHADIIYTVAFRKDIARSYYDDFRSRVVAAGRDPEHVLIMPGVKVYVAPTRAEAIEMYHELARGIDVPSGLIQTADAMGGVDLSGLDLDDKVPTERLDVIGGSQAQRGRPAMLRGLARDEGYTVRRLMELVLSTAGHGAIVGSPTDVVDHFADWFDDHAADGFNILPSNEPDGVRMFVDEVVPILQERGYVKTQYREGTLRDKLGLPPAYPA
ncbi:NtaA/DmoA family FMN-dependent monooxygenase [Streptosporangium sp. NPDC049644]|uniref:NtaA/DmoA family FMN-dependent monooxygenase n=1 Tax=Streptosporangium sp. NPDC049644 TaxID=3155507 RepID=UPI00343503AD